MVQEAADTVETQLSNRIVLGTVAGLGAVIVGLLTAGGIGIWNMSLAQSVQTEQIHTLANQVADFKAALSQSSADRYTGASAASDRAAFLQSFTAALNSQATSFGDLLKASNDRLQAISIRQTEFDRSLKDLLVFQAQMQERARMEDRKP